MKEVILDLRKQIRAPLNLTKTISVKISLFNRLIRVIFKGDHITSKEIDLINKNRDKRGVIIVDSLRLYD